MFANGTHIWTNKIVSIFLVQPLNFANLRIWVIYFQYFYEIDVRHTHTHTNTHSLFTNHILIISLAFYFLEWKKTKRKKIISRASLDAYSSVIFPRFSVNWQYFVSNSLLNKNIWIVRIWKIEIRGKKPSSGKKINLYSWNRPKWRKKRQSFQALNSDSVIKKLRQTKNRILNDQAFKIHFGTNVFGIGNFLILPQNTETH